MTTRQKNYLLLMFYYEGQFAWNIPMLLYYPVGVMYKVPFRYQDSWIASNLFDIKEHIFKEALIVMKFKSLEGTGRQRYIPIRKVTILKSERVGDYSFFHMKLGEFVKFDDSSIFQYSQFFIEKLRGSDDQKLVQECTLDPELSFISNNHEEEEINNWFRIVNLIMKDSDIDLDVYKNTLFLKFHSILESGSKSLKPIPLHSKILIKILHWLLPNLKLLKNLLNKIYNYTAPENYWGYRLRFNKKYLIKIIQHFKPDEDKTYEIKDSEIILDLPDKTFFPGNKSSLIIGHQDVFNFSFNVCGSSKIDTCIILKSKEGRKPIYKESGDPLEKELIIHEINIPVQVRHTLWSFLKIHIFPILIFIIGSFLVTISTTESMEIPFVSNIENDLWLPWVKIIELVFGLVFQGIGLYTLKGDK